MISKQSHKTQWVLGQRNAGSSDGFTLIELLIVMSIIAILALVAVTSYTGVQRQASVDFAVDTLVATIREAEDWSRSGRREVLTANSAGEEGSSAICYAVKLVEGGEEAGVYSAKTNYISVDADQVDTCTLVGSSGWRKSDVFNDRITLIGKKEETILTYYFKPPFGKILQEENGDLTPTRSQIVFFNVGDPDYPEWNRTVHFDLSTGEVKKVNVLQ